MLCKAKISLKKLTRLAKNHGLKEILQGHYSLCLHLYLIGLHMLHTLFCVF